ncbi:MAG: sugar kinase [Verrucomicrobiota bacterium]
MNEPSSENKVILITRKTRLDELITRYNTMDQARFVIESQGADFTDYIAEHERYYSEKLAAERMLKELCRVQVIDRDHLANFIFGKDDTVVTLGQDGLVANTLKYLSGQKLIGVNPDPARWDGILLPFCVGDLPTITKEVISNKRSIKNVSMAKATLNDGQTLHAVNDLFIGPQTHFSARYEIVVGKYSENHSSSGIIVSTGFGSTGWLASLMKGATKLTSALTQRNLDIKRSKEIPWDANYLYYTVREPFPSNVTQTDLVFGKIEQNTQFTVRSQIAERGVIFSDGIESDFLKFNAGAEVNISISEKVGRLVI